MGKLKIWDLPVIDSNAKLKGFNKYDVWTNVLNNKIMTICYNRLSSKEKKIIIL